MALDLPEVTFDIAQRRTEQLEKAVGTHLGFSDWHTVSQEQIDRFAEAAGDHQWIHVDPEPTRMKASRGAGAPALEGCDVRDHVVSNECRPDVGDVARVIE